MAGCIRSGSFKMFDQPDIRGLRMPSSHQCRVRGRERSQGEVFSHAAVLIGDDLTSETGFVNTYIKECQTFCILHAPRLNSSF